MAGIQYGGIFLAVSVFSLLGGNDVGRSVKPEYIGICSVVMQCDGNFLVVGGFSFFRGNDFGGSGN